MISIDKTSNKSLYEQLYEQMKSEILNEHYAAGEKLPATRQLAVEHKLSRNTVVSAYNQLELEGYIRSVTGSMMRRGLRAKFQQNPELMEKLLATGNMVLAECAPRDKIWGIGLAEDDARIQDPQQWKGQNLLGTVLMEVRSDLRCWVAVSDGKVEYIDAMDMPDQRNLVYAFPGSL